MKDERALLDTLSAALAEAPIAFALDGASPTGQRFPSRSLATMVLALLVGGHLAVVLTILVNEAVFWRMIDAGQRYFLIGHPKPWVISLLVGGFFGLFALHTFIALRKLPWPVGPVRTLTAWAHHLRHPDTALWLSQLITGFALFFLCTSHLYAMVATPSLTSPQFAPLPLGSAHFWALLMVLLFGVEFHGGMALYRRAVAQRGHSTTPHGAPRPLIRLRRGLTTFFVTLLLSSLAAYLKIGSEHQLPVW